MEGRSHLLLGACGFMVAGPAAAHALGQDLSYAQLAAGTLVCSGAAMLPDLDTENSTIAHALGPLTMNIARIVGPLSGGHRNGTHSLLAVLLVSALVAGLLGLPSGPAIALGLCIFFISLTVKVMLEGSLGVRLVVSGLLGATVVSAAPGSQWITLSIGMGVILHMLGDALTSEGVPLLYPFSKKRFRVPVIQSTGNRVEHGISWAMGLATVYLAFAAVFVPMWQHSRSNIQAADPKAKPAASLTAQKTAPSLVCRQLKKQLDRENAGQRANRAWSKVC